MDTMWVGLHITKCAGTSLITSLRHRMAEDEYYFCSSYYENFLAGRNLLSELQEPDRLRVVFGHFVNECMFPLFARKTLYLFTGLREPVARAISHYRQSCAVRVSAGDAPLTAGDFLDATANIMCVEILRCFPAITRLAPEKSRLEQALAGLSLFDFVYDSAEFARDAAFLFEQIGLSDTHIVSDNMYSDKQLPEAALAEMKQHEATILAAAPQHFADDIALYTAAQPGLGRRDFREWVESQPWCMARAPYLERLPTGEAANAACKSMEIGNLVEEFAILGKLPRLRGALVRRVSGVAAMLELVEGRCGGY